MASTVLELRMKLLTSILYSDHHAEQELRWDAWASTESAIKIINQLSTRAHMKQTINNIENYDDVINIFVLIENKCNNSKSQQWLKRHADGGRETMIQFVVAL